MNITNILLLPVLLLSLGASAQVVEPTLILRCAGSVSSYYNEKGEPGRTDKGDWTFWIDEKAGRSRLDKGPWLYQGFPLVATSDTRFFTLEDDDKKNRSLVRFEIDRLSGKITGAMHFVSDSNKTSIQWRMSGECSKEHAQMKF